jgi:hypothetical protein
MLNNQRESLSAIESLHQWIREYNWKIREHSSTKRTVEYFPGQTGAPNFLALQPRATKLAWLPAGHGEENQTRPKSQPQVVLCRLVACYRSRLCTSRYGFLLSSVWFCLCVFSFLSIYDRFVLFFRYLFCSFFTKSTVVSENLRCDFFFSPSNTK